MTGKSNHGDKLSFEKLGGDNVARRGAIARLSVPIEYSMGVLAKLLTQFRYPHNATQTEARRCDVEAMRCIVPFVAECVTKAQKQNDGEVYSTARALYHLDGPPTNKRDLAARVSNTHLQATARSLLESMLKPAKQAEAGKEYREEEDAKAVVVARLTLKALLFVSVPVKEVFDRRILWLVSAVTRASKSDPKAKAAEPEALSVPEDDEIDGGISASKSSRALVKPDDASLGILREGANQLLNELAELCNGAMDGRVFKGLGGDSGHREAITRASQFARKDGEAFDMYVARFDECIQHLRSLNIHMPDTVPGQKSGGDAFMQQKSGPWALVSEYLTVKEAELCEDVYTLSAAREVLMCKRPDVLGVYKCTPKPAQAATVTKSHFDRQQHLKTQENKRLQDSIKSFKSYVTQVEGLTSGDQSHLHPDRIRQVLTNATHAVKQLMTTSQPSAKMPHHTPKRNRKKKKGGGGGGARTDSES
jgi:hypothetical protein